MNEEQISRIRARLEEERSTVERQLEDYGADVHGDRIEVRMDEGFADSGSATAQRAQVFSMVERLQETYLEVTEALRKLDEGSFGRCERCGKPVGDERLEAIPTARLCLDCKQAVGSR